ncbi:MAG: cytochrome c oxidase subunit II [Rhizonema sp. NSF051]|nr:cytochrome c oxidase subunit II [Rhizonema sp. NSF051]
MRKTLNALLLAVFIAVILGISHWVGQEAYSWMPPQATAEAKRVDEIFSFLASVGTFIFLGITGVILYSIITCRAPKGDWTHGHPARGSAKLETLWTVVPTILVLWVALESFHIYEELNILGLTQIVHLHIEEPASANTVHIDGKPITQEIRVIASQSGWSFIYPDKVTRNELHLPMNDRIRLVLNSEDVLHGFYVPEFRFKQDIVPKRDIAIVIDPIRAGQYRLNDSQFSGTNFALMQANVFVESRQAYDQWLMAATNQPTLASNQAAIEPTQQSKRIFNSHWQTVQPVEPTIVNDSRSIT